MFYSHLLLSRKGTLGIVWMAAHCHKRLKKDQVQQTNISASVDKILDEEVPVVTHRILAFLLLGVVRIYSKKVEYLFDDCHDALNKLCSGFNTGKNKHAGIGNSLKYFHSIVLPNSFELDAFDLEIFEDQDLVGGNVRSRHQIMLAEVCQKDHNANGMRYKESNTPPRDVLSPHYLDNALLVGPSFNTKNSLSDPEILRGTGFLLEDRMDPMVLDEAEEEHILIKASKDDQMAIIVGATKEIESDSVENLYTNICNTVPSLEIIRGTRSPLEDHVDHTVLDDAGKEQMMDNPCNDHIRTDFPELIQDVEYNHVVSPLTHGNDLVESSGIPHGSGVSLECCPSLKISSEAEKDEQHGITDKHVENPQSRLSFQVDGPHNFPELVDKADLTVVNKKKCLEVITSDSMNCNNMDVLPTSIVAPDPKLPDRDSPKVANIPTPAAKEQAKVRKKRKILFDLTTILPNRVIKNWIEKDTIDIKRTRKEVPLGPLQAWRGCKLTHTTQGFAEPLISGLSTDLAFLQCEKSCAAAISAMELFASPIDVQSPIMHEVNEQILEMGSLGTDRSPEQTLLAPGTPVSRLIPFRSHEIRTTADSDILEPSTSLESIEKLSSSDSGLELDAAFCEQINLCDGDSREKYTYSARARILGSYLHRKFMAKRRKDEEEVLNVSQLLKGKTKKESARLFYEILVLKSKDCIDVQQENAYNDIMLREASELRPVVEYQM